MPPIYYMVIQRRKIHVILSYQTGFLKKNSQICPVEGPLI